MTGLDDRYSERNARDAAFSLAETSVMLWSMGSATLWEKAFFALVAESDPVTVSELKLLFPNLVDAYTEFIDGDLRDRWYASHTEHAAARRKQGTGDLS